MCDSIKINHEGVNYLFTQEFDKNYSFDSLNIYQYDQGQWILCCNSPIVLGKDNARMAGNIIKENNCLIRVAQDCEGTYGRAINFNRIEELTTEKYCEVTIRRIEPINVKCNADKRCYDGIHTYNVNENYEVIDLKRNEVFHIGNLFNLFYRIK